MPVRRRSRRRSSRRPRPSTERLAVAAETEAKERNRRSIAVIGAGSWGTALAIHLARTGHATVLWGRDPAALADMAATRSNRRYLPDAVFPDGLAVEPDLSRAVDRALDLLIAVPSHGFSSILADLRPMLRDGIRIAWATKGFEVETGRLPHQVAAEVLGEAVPTAVLSGPTFAREVGAGLPTAMTIASRDEAYALSLAQGLSGPNFRAYTSSDMIGVEVGGATKNVLAIGAGISDGLGFGANTRVALITRGLAEMMRLGVALGAEKDTFMGLAGLGDLVLTCTDDQSRNRRLGLMLAAGRTLTEAQAAIGQVVEGVLAARAVRAVARGAGVEMPITEQLYAALYEGAAPSEAVAALMRRAVKSEVR
jgi:glycerol-3-phosphate dehydrogenase (NAD(P)+)